MLFLEQPEQNKLTLLIRRIVVQITMLKSGIKEPLYVENTNSIFNNWEDESKIKKFGRNCLLISIIPSFIINILYIIGYKIEKHRK